MLYMQSIAAKENTMRYIDIIQSGVDYIEDNLKTEITAQLLSDMAGFSVWHYYRLFQQAVGMPVMQYVTRRRLLWCAYEMANGARQTDAAINYGFDTAAGMYKAFRREFGCSPSEYMKRFRVRKPYRIHLLQEEHIMITTNKIKDILRAWDMQDERIQSVVETEDGNVRENTFYIGEKYVLKLFSSLGKMRSNVSILTSLSRTGLAPGTPLPTLAGDPYVSDGELYFVLMHRIDGSEFDVNLLFGEAGERYSHCLGQAIGRLHQALSENEEIICNDRDIYREVCEAWLAPAAAAMGLDDGFCEEYRSSFGALHDALPVQPIHRDPNPSNIIMKDGEIAGFIDFDLSQRSIRLFDPCYAATAVLCELVSDGDDRIARWPQVLRGIIEGYDEIACLTEREKEAVYYVVLSIQLICVGYFGTQEKFSELAEINRTMLRWIIDNRSKIEK